MITINYRHDFRSVFVRSPHVLLSRYYRQRIKPIERYLGRPGKNQTSFKCKYCFRNNIVGLIKDGVITRKINNYNNNNMSRTIVTVNVVRNDVNWM